MDLEDSRRGRFASRNGCVQSAVDYASFPPRGPVTGVPNRVVCFFGDSRGGFGLTAHIARCLMHASAAPFLCRSVNRTNIPGLHRERARDVWCVNCSHITSPLRQHRRHRSDTCAIANAVPTRLPDRHTSYPIRNVFIAGNTDLRREVTRTRRPAQRIGGSMTASWFRVMALAVAMTCTATATASAQSVGTISGTVKDESGAAIPGAVVTARNQGTGAVREVSDRRRGPLRDRRCCRSARTPSPRR